MLYVEHGPLLNKYLITKIWRNFTVDGCNKATQSQQNPNLQRVIMVGSGTLCENLEKCEKSWKNPKMWKKIWKSEKIAPAFANFIKKFKIGQNFKFCFRWFEKIESGQN